MRVIQMNLSVLPLLHCSKELHPSFRSTIAEPIESLRLTARSPNKFHIGRSQQQSCEREANNRAGLVLLVEAEEEI